MIHTVTPEQAKRAITLLMSAQVPVFMEGPSGCGKTSIVEELHAELQAKASSINQQFHLWRLTLAYVDPTDIGGVMHIDKRTKLSSYYPPSFLPVNTTEAGILFLDEVDRAPPEVLNGCLQLVAGGHIHNHTLSPNAYPVLAGNTLSDIYTTKLSVALRARVCTLYLSTRNSQTLPSWMSWAIENDISPEIMGYVAHKPDVLETEEKFSDDVQCQNRSIEHADRVVKALRKVQFRTDDIALPVIAGIVGAGRAGEILAHMKHCKDLPDPLKVLEQPSKAVIPDNPSMKHALIMGIVAVVRARANDPLKDYIDKAMTYFKRLPGEFAHFGFHHLGRMCDEAAKRTDFIMAFEKVKS